MIRRKAHNTNDADRDLERLRDLLHQTTPTEPDADAWSNVFARIEQRLHSPQSVPVRRNQAWLWSMAFAGAGAAAILIAVLLRPSPAPVAPLNEIIEPLPVASADEIEILSVSGADTQTVIVGKPPVDEAIELLGPGDVALFSVEPAADDMIPEISFHGDSLPMIWAHLDDNDNR